MHIFPIQKVYAVEVSGACNLEKVCTQCPMHNRPRMRPRGLMSDEVVSQAIQFVKAHKIEDPLALHNFGEPLLHPKFDEIAEKFSQLSPITMSTNGVLLDENWADRLSKIPWAWITVSPWDKEAQRKAVILLAKKHINVMVPQGTTHNFAGQAEGPVKPIFQGCPFLSQAMCVIRWDGSIASCCITDRAEDSLGTIFQPLKELNMHGYDLCKKCHHTLSERALQAIEKGLC